MLIYFLSYHQENSSDRINKQSFKLFYLFLSGIHTALVLALNQDNHMLLTLISSIGSLS